MSRRVFIGVAWPYVNGEKHIGQIAGAYLPADIFARFQRMAGNEVLMVGGSDTHGTPIQLKAEAERVPCAEIVGRYHRLFVAGCLAMGLTFDFYTHTASAIHHQTVQRVFRRHLGHGFMYRDRQRQ